VFAHRLETRTSEMVYKAVEGAFGNGATTVRTSLMTAWYCLVSGIWPLDGTRYMWASEIEAPPTSNSWTLTLRMRIGLLLAPAWYTEIWLMSSGDVPKSIVTEEVSELMSSNGNGDASDVSPSMSTVHAAEDTVVPVAVHVVPCATVVTWSAPTEQCPNGGGGGFGCGGGSARGNILLEPVTVTDLISPSYAPKQSQSSHDQSAPPAHPEDCEQHRPPHPGCSGVPQS